MRVPIVSEPVRRGGLRRGRSGAGKRLFGLVMSQEIEELPTDEGDIGDEGGEFGFEESIELPLDFAEGEQELLGATEG